MGRPDAIWASYAKAAPPWERRSRTPAQRTVDRRRVRPFRVAPAPRPVRIIRRSRVAGAQFPPARFPSGVGVPPLVMSGTLLAGAGGLATTRVEQPVIVLGGPPGWPGVVPAVAVAVVAVGAWFLLRVTVVGPVRRLRDDVLAGSCGRRVRRSVARDVDRIATQVRALRRPVAGWAPGPDRYPRLPMTALLVLVGFGVLGSLGVSYAAMSRSSALDAPVLVAETGKDAARASDRLRSALLGGLSMVQGVSGPAAGGLDRRAIVSTVLASRPVFRAVYVLDRAGRPVAAAGAEPALAAGARPGAGIRQLNTSGSAPLIVAVAPLYDGDTLVGEYDPRALNDVLRVSGCPDTRGRPGPAHRPEQPRLCGVQRVARSRAAGRGHGPGPPAVPVAALRTVDDVEATVAARRIGADGDPLAPLGWVLLADQELGAGEFAHNPAARAAAVVTGLAAGIVLAVLCWIYIATVRPLRGAAAHAAAIAAAGRGGDLPEPAPARRVDEIGAIVAGTQPAPARRGCRSDHRPDTGSAVDPQRGPTRPRAATPSSPRPGMTYLFTLYALGCALVLVAGIIEQRRHHRHLRSIPRRIVVNGIRGKSSITRLCAGALRGGGLVTVAKTTGTAARFITPDGHEEPVYRKFGLANLVEQIGIVRRAAAHRPDALVIECMAVLPDLQEVNERKLIRSTICVISNVREDHLTEMGPDPGRRRAVAVAVDARRRDLRDRRAGPVHVLRDEAGRRSTALIQVDPESVTDDEIRRFPYIAFKENVAIALAVAELAGIDRATALRGMIAARPDPGTVTVTTYRAGTAADHLRQHLRRQRPGLHPDEHRPAHRPRPDQRPAQHRDQLPAGPDRAQRSDGRAHRRAEPGADHPHRRADPQCQGRGARPARSTGCVDLGGPLDFPALLDALVTDASGAACAARDRQHPRPGRGPARADERAAHRAGARHPVRGGAGRLRPDAPPVRPPRPRPALRPPRARLMLHGTLAPQVATIALAIGLLFALTCYLTTNLSPGGMITPGWLALTLAEDVGKVAVIVGVTAVTYLGIRVLQRIVILYGKRLFAAVMMLSVLLSTGLFLVVQRRLPAAVPPRDPRVHHPGPHRLPAGPPARPGHPHRHRRGQPGQLRRARQRRAARPHPGPLIRPTARISDAQSPPGPCSGRRRGRGHRDRDRARPRRRPDRGRRLPSRRAGRRAAAVPAPRPAGAHDRPDPRRRRGGHDDRRRAHRRPARPGADLRRSRLHRGHRRHRHLGPLPAARVEPGRRAANPGSGGGSTQALRDTSPDLFAVAVQYLHGQPTETDPAGLAYRGDAGFGPELRGAGTGEENSDFYDYLGMPWTFPDGKRATPDPARYRDVDCSGFLRLVLGYRMGFPLRNGNGPGAGLPRRAYAMAAVGPGTTVIPDAGTTAADYSALQPGDLVFFDIDIDIDGLRQIDHAAIYLGLDDTGHHRFLSSRRTADGPTLGDLGGTSLLDDGGYYSRGFRTARRI